MEPREEPLPSPESGSPAPPESSPPASPPSGSTPASSSPGTPPPSSEKVPEKDAPLTEKQLAAIASILPQAVAPPSPGTRGARVLFVAASSNLLAAIAAFVAWGTTRGRDLFSEVPVARSEARLELVGLAALSLPWLVVGVVAAWAVSRRQPWGRGLALGRGLFAAFAVLGLLAVSSLVKSPGTLASLAVGLEVAAELAFIAGAVAVVSSRASRS